MKKLLHRVAARFRRPSSPAEAARARARRQKALLAKGAVVLPYLQLLLALAGVLQYFAIPLPIQALLKKSFIDENAFQPGQVNTYFSWADVSAGDRYADDLHAFVNSNDSLARAEYIANALREQGLSAFKQQYAVDGSQVSQGYNVYSRLKAPKTSGSEVVVLCAPWNSRQAGLKNVRGAATLLAFAKHLQKLSMWSKDIVLLFSDGALEGTQAWLAAYHGSTKRKITPLPIGGGSIWGSITVDYPYHSFSHISLYYEGVNGRLPNLDVVHGASHIARWVGGVPVRLHSQSFTDFPTELSATDFLARYQQRAAGVVQQVVNTMTTLPAGSEGLFSQYGVESIAFFAVPAEGPHGFYAIGRIVESMTRAFNNLSERLHASFFLYLLPEPFQFLSVATYLSAPLLIGAALTIAGLRLWHTKTSSNGVTLCVSILSSYIIGGLLLLMDHSEIAIQSLLTAAIAGLAVTSSSQLSALLALECLTCGMLISVTTILNYGLGTGLAVLVGLPSLVLVYMPRSKHAFARRATLGLALTLLANVTIKEYGQYRQTFDSIPTIAPAVLYVTLIPMWIQLAGAL